jgi:hypothetical protein
MTAMVKSGGNDGDDAAAHVRFVPQKRTNGQTSHQGRSVLPKADITRGRSDRYGTHLNHPHCYELHLCSRVAGPGGFDGPIASEKVTTRNGLVTVAIVRATCRNRMSITETEFSKLFGTKSSVPSPVSA